MDQQSFNQKVYDSTDREFVINGKAAPENDSVYLVSSYDESKPRELLLNTVSHELVHLFYGHYRVWVNEGMAHYVSGMNRVIEAPKLPGSISDLIFCRDDSQRIKEACHFSAWIIKYLYEEIFERDFKALEGYLADFEDYGKIGCDNENMFFLNWRAWMESGNNVILPDS